MSKLTKDRIVTGQEQAYGRLRFEESVENFKRRRALPMPFSVCQERDAHFFNRALSVDRIKDFIFITKAEAAAR